MMKKTTRIISLFMAILMLAGSIPMLAIPAAAKFTPQAEPEYPQYKSYSEFETKMDADAIAGIYVDGKLVYQEKKDLSKKNVDIRVFEEAIKKYAPKVKDGDIYGLHAERFDNLKEVRVVLNQDLHGKIHGLHEVSNIALVIDLNGHLMYQAKTSSGGSAEFSFYSCDITVIDSNPSKVHKAKMSDNQMIIDDAGPLYFRGGAIVGNYPGYTENPKYTSRAGFVVFSFALSRFRLVGASIRGFNTKIELIHLLSSGTTFGLYKGAEVSYNKTTSGLIGLSGMNRVTGDTTGYIRNNYTTLGAIWAYGTQTYDDEKAYKYELTESLIENVRILGNICKNNGAGINVSHPCTIKNVSLVSNTAYVKGGGVFFYKGGTMQNCTVYGNYSYKRGGGIAVRSKTLSLSNCEITKNASLEHGGGVLVEPDATVSASGLMTIKQNCKRSAYDPPDTADNSNLYLQGNNDFVPGTLDLKSEIWIRTGKSADEYNGKGHTLTKGGHTSRTGVHPSIFWADNTKYYVSLIDDTSHKNYRNLCFVKGTRPVYKDVKVLTNYDTVEIGTYTTKLGATYPLYKGYFEYNLMTTSEYYSASPFYYTDGYFAEDPTYYNPHLATMSINMAVAAFGRSTSYVGDNAYANHFANVKQLMSDIGCADENFYANKGYQNEPELFSEGPNISTIGVAMSHKTVYVENKPYILLPVAIRGGSYEVEWGSNVTIGKEGEAKGFADAANQVYAEIQQYLKNYGLESKAAAGQVKFWVTGYSRAGATTNLTSKRLVDNYGAVGNQVFGYSFEAPMGGVESAILKAPHTGDGTYPTIHNTVNENDFVTLVAPKEMGFIRYGIDHLVGSNTDGGSPVSYKKDSTYWKQREKMAAQLAAINPYYVFDDYWESADLNIYFGLSSSSSTPLTEPMKATSDEYLRMKTALEAFFYRVQKYGLNVDEEDFRKTYSSSAILKNVKKDSNKGKKYSDKDYFFGNSDYTIEQSVRTLMGIMYSIPSNKMSQIMDLAMSNFMTRLNKKSTINQSRFLDNYLFEWAHWYKTSNAKDVDILLHMLFDPLDKEQTSIWSLLTKEQGEQLAKALPVVLYFLFDFISRDYSRTGKTFNTGSFVHNMSSIISNHYQEVSVAWVRSYDDYYANDLQAYRLEKTSTSELEYSYATKNDVLTLSAEPGSSIFYSVDNGVTWKLYTSAVRFDTRPEKILAFSINRGVKSEEKTIKTNKWSGSILGNGNVWFVVAGATAIVAGAVVTAEVMRKKRKKGDAS